MKPPARAVDITVACADGFGSTARWSGVSFSLQSRAAHRFVVRKAVRDAAVHELFPVKTELIVQFLFHGAAPNERRRL